MPRTKLSDMTDEQRQAHEARKAELAANPPEATTERNITVRVSKEAIEAAKALGTLSGLPYREVMATAAQAGVADLVLQVQAKLNGNQSESNGHQSV